MTEVSRTVKLKLSRDMRGYVRAANRFIKEYKETFRTDYLPAEIQAAADKLKLSETIELVDDEFKHDMFFPGTEPRTAKSAGEWHVSGYWEQDEYGEDYYEFSYYFFERSWYEARLMGVLHSGSFAKVRKECYQQMGEFKYLCNHRPPARGCIPEGYETYTEYPRSHRYCGEVTYNAAPDSEELYKWGLELDKEWPELRKNVLEQDDEK